MAPSELSDWRKSLLAEMEHKAATITIHRFRQTGLERRKSAQQVKTVAEFIRLTTAATTNADMAAVEQDWNRWCKRTERNA